MSSLRACAPADLCLKGVSGHTTLPPPSSRLNPALAAPPPLLLQVNFFRAGIPPGPFFKGLFVPTLSATSIIPAVGALGALVMPYNLYFHSSIVNSRWGVGGVLGGKGGSGGRWGGLPCPCRALRPLLPLGHRQEQASS